MKSFAVCLLVACACIFTTCKKKEDNKPTEEVPLMATVSSRNITSITDSTAVYGGNVSSAGRSALIAVGVCWDIKPGPTVNGKHTNNGSNTGDFSGTLDKLTSGTTYYVRTYATNSSGTAYGEEIQFKTTGIAKWRLLKSASLYEDFLALAAKGPTLFAGTSEGVYTSVDGGLSWVPKNSGIANNTMIRNFVVSGENVFAAIDAYSTIQKGILRSSDNGNSWSFVNNGLSDLSVGCIVVRGSTLFAATLGGVFKSEDAGDNWTPINSGLSNTIVNTLTLLDTTIFAVTAGGVFMASTKVNSWTSFNNGPVMGSYLLTAVGPNLYGLAYNGLYISTDKGANWTHTSNHEAITFFTGEGPDLYTVAFNRVKFSNDGGVTWTDKNEGFQGYINAIYCLLIVDNQLFAGTDQGIYVISL